MLTGFTEDVRQFDSYLNENYSKLRNTAQQITWGNDFEDILHNSIMKIRDRIARSGWTSTTYSHYTRAIYSFIWRAIQNEHRTRTRPRTNKPIMIDFNNEDFEQRINEAIDRNDHDSEPYYQSMDNFVKSLFSFLDANYPEQHATLFKTYFLTNENTYRKLVSHSGMSLKYIREIISQMKKDIKANKYQIIKK